MLLKEAMPVVSVGREMSLQTLGGQPAIESFLRIAPAQEPGKELEAGEGKEGEESEDEKAEKPSKKGKEKEPKGREKKEKAEKKEKSDKKRKGKEGKEKGGKKKKKEEERKGSGEDDSSLESEPSFSPDDTACVHEAHKCFYEGKEVEYWTDDVDKHHPMPPLSLKIENAEEYKLKIFLRGRAKTVLRNRSFRARESLERKEKKEKKEGQKGRRIKKEEEGGKKRKKEEKEGEDSDVQEIPAPTAKKGKEEGKQAKGQAAAAGRRRTRVEQGGLEAASRTLLVQVQVPAAREAAAGRDQAEGGFG